MRSHLASVARGLPEGAGSPGYPNNSRGLGMELQPVTTTAAKPANRMKRTREWVVMATTAYQQPTPSQTHPALCGPLDGRRVSHPLRSHRRGWGRARQSSKIQATAARTMSEKRTPVHQRTSGPIRATPLAGPSPLGGSKPWTTRRREGNQTVTGALGCTVLPGIVTRRAKDARRRRARRAGPAWARGQANSRRFGTGANREGLCSRRLPPHFLSSFCSHHFIKSRFTCHELTMAFMASEGRSAFTAEAAESRGAVCDERLC